MKTEAHIINRLNVNLKYQITTINQSFLHARIAGHWGFDKLNRKFYSVSISAMKSADSLIDRILFLERMPNLQAIGKLSIGENVPDILENEMQLMTKSRENLTQSIEVLEKKSDYESRAQLMPILDFTEEYIDWLETQKWLIHEMGIENYNQSQIGDEIQ